MLVVWMVSVIVCSVANSQRGVANAETQDAKGSLRPMIGHTRVDTEYWLGSEYTPAGAPGNGLWFHWYDAYAAAVDRELAVMRQQLRVTAIRVWLHDMVFANNSERLFSNMDRLLTSAAKNNISIGFVFFDDCWNHAGASLEEQCVPQKGVHNGCWMASPQDVDRNQGYEPFKPYVSLTVRRFKDDARVLWWEVFNEPRKTSWSMGLRDAAYRWAKAEAPHAPVLACWDDSNDTDILDHHDYGTEFTKWQKIIYSNPQKGAFVTEAGSRWFQPQPIGSVNEKQADQGSPLTILNFLTALREQKRQGKLLYVPGIMLCWTVFVSNDNTRWHWGTKAGSAEPAIPWDGMLFPDGTPVSHTEAAAFRRYVTGFDEFLFFENFLPSSIVNGDIYQKLPAGNLWVANVSKPIREAVFEFAIWADGNGDGVVAMTVRAQTSEAVTKANSSFGDASVSLAKRYAERGVQNTNTSHDNGGALFGYTISLTSKGKSLSILRTDATRSRKILGSCSLAKLDNGGVILSAWNLVRVALSDASGATTIRVWVNPMFPETGFVGNASDASRIPVFLPPRLSVVDLNPLPAGGLAVVADSRDSRLDYVSALPISVLNVQTTLEEQPLPSLFV